MKKGTNKVKSRNQLTVVTLHVIIDVTLWLSVAIPTLYLFLQGTPYQRGFFCGDESISYPYKPDTIPTTVLIVAGCLIAIAVFVLTEVLNCVDSKCRRPCQPLSDTFYCLKSCAVFLVGFIIQELVVEVVKSNMGVLRPNFIDVCRPTFNQTLCPGYISEYSCTGSEYGEHTVIENRKSFPSGHASFSMYIAAFLCIYIQTRLQIKFSKILKFLIQSGLIFLALVCGLGRVKDNKHHPSDVIAGLILGITVAVLVCKTVGRSIIWPGKDTISEIIPTHTISKTCEMCCSAVQTPNSEPQTPSPLIPNEYFHRVSSGLETSPPALQPVPNTKTRTLSIQVKPFRAPECV